MQASNQLWLGSTRSTDEDKEKDKYKHKHKYRYQKYKKTEENCQMDILVFKELKAEYIPLEIVNQDGRSQGDLSFKFIVSGVITIYTEID